MFKGIDHGIFWVKDQPVSLSTAPKGTLDVTAFRDVVPKHSKPSCHHQPEIRLEKIL